MSLAKLVESLDDMTTLRTFLLVFASRRRHTRSLCDWSSDVCSSDLSAMSSFGNERIAGILRSFPKEDIAELREDPVTTVTCEFCNTRYEFTPDDLAPLDS